MNLILFCSIFDNAVHESRIQMNPLAYITYEIIKWTFDGLCCELAIWFYSLCELRKEVRRRFRSLFDIYSALQKLCTLNKEFVFA